MRIARQLGYLGHPDRLLGAEQMAVIGLQQGSLLSSVLIVSGGTGFQVGDMLTASSENERVDYRMIDPTVLEGRYHANGSTPGSFAKTQ